MNTVEQLDATCTHPSEPDRTKCGDGFETTAKLDTVSQPLGGSLVRNLSRFVPADPRAPTGP